MTVITETTFTGKIEFDDDAGKWSVEIPDAEIKLIALDNNDLVKVTIDTMRGLGDK